MSALGQSHIYDRHAFGIITSLQPCTNIKILQIILTSTFIRQRWYFILYLSTLHMIFHMKIEQDKSTLSL